MTTSHQGAPCWYELSTTDIDGAQRFYSAALGWNVTDSGMAGMDYRLAALEGSMVAGIAPAQADQPTAWTIYFAVTDCDTSFAEAVALAATPIVPPSDVPGTGRFAVLIDPQGAAFGILQPEPMPDGSIGEAFHQDKPGHGNWHEIICPDPAKALTFYGQLFGWMVARAVPMGPSTYHVIGWQGTEIGGAFTPETDGPARWLTYFTSAGVAASQAAVTAAGGAIDSGPDAVPGGVYSLQCSDPQGGAFAFVGPM